MKPPSERCDLLNTLPLAVCLLCLCLVSTARAERASDPVRLLPPVVEVNGLDGHMLSLDGQWQFVRDVPEGFPASVGDIAWEAVTIPGHFALQGLGRMHQDNGVPVAYRLVFDVPEAWRGRGLTLYFDSIDGLTHAWVNGQPIGSSESAFMPVQFDITDAATPGGSNELLIRVAKSDLTGWYLRELGGIGRSVRLIATPTTHITRLHADADFDENYEDATLRVHLGVTQTSDNSADKLAVQLTLTGPDGQSQSFDPIPLPDISTGDEHRDVIELDVTRPAHWDVEHPNMYTLFATLTQGGQALMTSQRRLGFREIEVRGRDLLVNGQPIKLRATNYHVTYAGFGHHPPPRLVRRDIQLLVQANLNALRSWPTPPPAYTDACDELGMFTTIEVPMNLMIYAPGPKKDHGDNPALTDPYLKLTERMIETYRSHPSVLFWGLANESPYYEYFQKGAQYIKQADPSRPIFLGSDNRLGIGIPHVDVNDDHYPRNGRADIDKPGVITGGHWDEFPRDRPIMFTEWCHIHVNNQNELAADPGIDDYWGYYAQTHNEYVFNTPGILGGYIFKSAPYREIANKIPWRGFFDDNRRPNDLYWHVKKSSSPIKAWIDQAQVNQAGDTLTLEVANRHDFTDLSELDINWCQGDKQGKIEVEAGPHETASVTMPVDPDTTEPIEITFTSPRGFELDRYTWRPDTDAPAEPSPAASGISVTEAEGRINIVVGDITWRIDQKTGRALHGQHGDTKIITGGPHLIVRQSAFKSWHGQLNMPVQNKATNWRAQDVTSDQQHGQTTVTVKGRYDQAQGAYTYTITPDGNLQIAYDFIWTADETVDAFEVGLAIDTPGAFSTLRWDRDAQWSAYPDWHIGRPTGEAPVDGEPRWAAVRDARYVGTDPTPWPWSQDLIDGATRDFRSSKFNFKRAGLFTQNGAGIQATAIGRQHVRAAPRTGGFHLQVADFHNGGTEAHLLKSLRIEVLKVQKGTRLIGQMMLRLIPNDSAKPVPQNEAQLKIMD